VLRIPGLTRIRDALIATKDCVSSSSSQIEEEILAGIRHTDARGNGEDRNACISTFAALAAESSTATSAGRSPCARVSRVPQRNDWRQLCELRQGRMRGARACRHVLHVLDPAGSARLFATRTRCGCGKRKPRSIAVDKPLFQTVSHRYSWRVPHVSAFKA